MRTLDDFRNPPPLTHLKRLTTREGLIQHADLDVPDPSHGYSLDDNARALIACLWHYDLYRDQSVLSLLEIYFSYLLKVEKEGGSFHNFLSFTERILDAEGSDDSIGRAIWALGEMIRLCPDDEKRQQASELIKRSNLSRHFDHPHLRTKAYVLLGLLAADETTEAKRWADKLVATYLSQATDDWPWFEDSLTYANGVLPYALAQAFLVLKDDQYLKVAKRAFDWLDTVSRIGDQPAPIGQAGWYAKGGAKAEYDQQPVDAAKMVLAATTLYQAAQDQKYLDKALEWMSWYDGHNSQQVAVIDPDTNGVFDAVTPSGVNKNQGAESIVTYLLAYLKLSAIKN